MSISRVLIVFCIYLVGLIGVYAKGSEYGQFAQGKQVTQIGQVLSLRERVKPANDIIKHRLEHLLPQLMDESDLDMWVVINREYGEDALFYTLVPHTTFAARRTTMLVFVKTADGLKRFTVSRYAIDGFYETQWQGGSDDEQWQRLADIIAQYDPKQIGINTSRDWALSDGLTHALHQRLTTTLSKKYRSRLVSAEPLVIRWLETRTEKELAIYPHIVSIARGVIAKAFSREVITPGATTTDDVAWMIRETFESLQLTPWFHPYVTVQRGSDINENSPFHGRSGRTIMPGDVLHTDVGICYLKMCTDTQEMAYVVRLGESDVPASFKAAMAIGNQWQDILTSQFVTGRTGNEILSNTIELSKDANIVSSTYTHPIGFVGHAIGPTIGMWDNQGPTPVRGDWPLFPNTAYAIEGNVKVTVPEWQSTQLQIMLEQSAVFDGKEVLYLGGRQTQWHIIQ